MDLVATGARGISFLRNQSSGIGNINFTYGPAVTGLGTAPALVLGDFDGDNLPDAAVTDQNAGAVYIVKNANLISGGVLSPTTVTKLTAAVSGQPRQCRGL